MPSSYDSFAQDVTAIILAGGHSRRMGEEKARLLIHREPLITRVARLLRMAFRRVAVVGPPELRDVTLDAQIIPDLRPEQGPLAGMESAFGATRTTFLFVVGCDMPFISPALALRMAARGYESDNVDAVVLHNERGPEPLHAVYRRDCQPHISALLDDGERSLHSLLARVTVAEIPPDEQSRFDPQGLATLNVNTPEDWRNALSLAELWRPSS